jgi:hypothetical protein
MKRQIAWEWLESTGLEYCTVEETADGICVRGLVVADFSGAMLRLRYEIQCETGWRFRNAVIESRHGENLKTLSLSADSRRDWSADGAPRPDLTDCTAIDIEGTPFTNTLPVRGFTFRPGESRTFDMAYIRIPDLAVARAGQEYTRLDATHFRYLSLSSGFTADLDFDADGLVKNYPAIWRMI